MSNQHKKKTALSSINCLLEKIGNHGNQHLDIT